MRCLSPAHCALLWLVRSAAENRDATLGLFHALHAGAASEVGHD
jgi:hypothetical protein